MGDGQLWQHLPASVRSRCLHTEPVAALSRAFQAEHPEVTIEQALAEALPVPSAAAAGVLGLCVMDVVPDGVAVVRELGRVLAPGGRFIHFLDMSTLLGPVVATLAGVPLLPLPNVFREPAATEWPEDLFLVPRRQLELIVGVLLRHGHELAKPMAEYLATFSTSPLAIDAAVAELVQLQDSSELRSALKVVFRFAHDQAEPAVRQQLASFQGRPVSSLRHFEQRLRAWFGEGSGFRIEQASVERVWEITARGDSAFSYMGCCVGEQRLLPYLPDALLCADATAPNDLEVLRELGVFVFVASRI